VNVQFHPGAEQELTAAVDWYAQRGLGLGVAFMNEVHAAIGRALSLPMAWPQVGKDVRRVLTSRFPYGVLYVVRGETLLVLAVMHTRQQPDYWRDRVA
jgi:toxin ParE1/3/4